MLGARRFLIVFLLLTLVGLYINLHEDVATPTKRSFSEFPAKQGQWQMVSQAEFTDSVLKVLKASDYVSRQYVGSDGVMVGLYVGYHSGGKDSGGIHSPKHCLPGSGWYEASTRRERLPVENGSLNVVRAMYQKGDQKELFVYWFQVRDRSLSDEYALKLAEISNSAFFRRRDSTFIRVSVPFETDEKKASAAANQFIRDFNPIIISFLPS